MYTSLNRSRTSTDSSSAGRRMSQRTTQTTYPKQATHHPQQHHQTALHRPPHHPNNNQYLHHQYQHKQHQGQDQDQGKRQLWEALPYPAYPPPPPPVLTHGSYPLPVAHTMCKPQKPIGHNLKKKKTATTEAMRTVTETAAGEEDPKSISALLAEKVLVTSGRTRYPTPRELSEMPLSTSVLVGSNYNIHINHWISNNVGGLWPEGYRVNANNLMWVLTSPEFNRSMTELRHISRCGTIVCMEAFVILRSVKSKLRLLDVFTEAAATATVSDEVPDYEAPPRLKDLSPTPKLPAMQTPTHQVVAVNINANEAETTLVCMPTDVKDLYSAGVKRVRLTQQFTGDMVWARRVVHPNIIDYIWSGIYSNIHYAVYNPERYGSTLREMFNACEREGRTLSHAVLLEIIRGVAEALTFLESYRLVHSGMDGDSVVVSDEASGRSCLSALQHVRCAPIECNPYGEQLLKFRAVLDDAKRRGLLPDVETGPVPLKRAMDVLNKTVATPKLLLWVMTGSTPTYDHEQTARMMCVPTEQAGASIRIKMVVPKICVRDDPQEPKLSMHRLPLSLYTKTQDPAETSFYQKGAAVVYRDLEKWPLLQVGGDPILYTGSKGCSVRCVEVPLHCFNYIGLRVRHPGLLGPMSVAHKHNKHLLLLFDTTKIFSLYGCIHKSGQLSVKDLVELMAPVVQFLAEREYEGIYPFAPEDPQVMVVVSPHTSKWSLTREPAGWDSALFTSVKVESLRWLAYLKALHDYFVDAANLNSPLSDLICEAKSLQHLASYMPPVSAYAHKTAEVGHVPFNASPPEESLTDVINNILVDLQRQELKQEARAEAAEAAEADEADDDDDHQTQHQTPRRSRRLKRYKNQNLHCRWKPGSEPWSSCL
ncbi:protein ORF48 [Cyprinid herpesvirus 3]|nr:protein ORF48 [Cyprinid herpesvirus 3]